MRHDASKILNPGNLREQITIRSKTITGQDSVGEPIVSRSTVVTCRARIRQSQGGQRSAEETPVEQVWQRQMYTVEMHYYEGLDTSMDILWYDQGLNRILEIISIDDPYGTRQVQIMQARSYPTTEVA